MINIKNNITAIEQQILRACQQNKRKTTDVSLLAVSKTKPIDLIEQAYQLGQHDFGENYLQEALEKIANLAHLTNICWHFIGPIQSNKTKLIAINFSWVHSVDRIKIIERLNTQRGEYLLQHPTIQPLNICLQVNISGEQTKSGIIPEQLSALALAVGDCAHLTLRGLMAIPEKNAPTSTYQKMHDLFNQLKAQHPSIDTLSLGMSNDLSQAVAAGSTMVRIGTALFGTRPTKNIQE